MSNMIKAYSVRYDEDGRKTIDNHLKKDSDILVKRNFRIAATEENNDFVEGLKAVVVDVVDKQPSIEEIKEQTDQILEDAKREAKAILEKARQDAETIKAETHNTFKKKGYDEGLQQGLQEVQNKLAECEETILRNQKEYEDLLTRMEPDMVELMAGLIEKITGILVEDKKEVILHLVEKAFLNLDKENEYTIRVSKEDYEYLTSKKEYLIGAVGRDIQLFMNEDPNLRKNQCLIETKLRVIDCSLDVQMGNLITELKLLSKI